MGRPKRTHCAICGVELSDANCYRTRPGGGFKHRCKTCGKARRVLKRKPPEPERTCSQCGMVWQPSAWPARLWPADWCLRCRAKVRNREARARSRLPSDNDGL